MRTNVVIDKELVERAMETYGFRTQRDAIDFALRRLVGYDPERILELAGTGWSGDLDVIRGKKSPPS